MKVPNIPFPIVITGLVFTGMLTLFFISSHDLKSDFNAIDQGLLIWTNSRHNSFMDHVMLLVESFYFWIPFYCFLVLMLLIYDKVRFMRMIPFLVLYLGIQNFSLFLLNNLLGHLRPLYLPYLASRLHIGTAGKGTAYGCIPMASNAVGIALFFCLYFDRRYLPLKILVAVWAGLLLYGRIYTGWNFPDEILLGTCLGLTLSFSSFIAYRYYLNRYYAC
jgi:membrane-associated phospholipid phosphatase